jgi:hypothetical protein
MAHPVASFLIAADGQATRPFLAYRIGKNVTFQLLVTMSWIFLLTQYRDVLLTRMNRGN